MRLAVPPLQRVPLALVVRVAVRRLAHVGHVPADVPGRVLL